MDIVKVSRTKILGKIKENRDKHRAIFEEAVAGYRKATLARLDEMCDEIKRGKSVPNHTGLNPPQDRTREYDRIIAMLEASEDELIVLNSLQFSQYMLDDWQWKRDFLHSNAIYSVSAASALNE